MLARSGGKAAEAAAEADTAKAAAKTSADTAKAYRELLGFLGLRRDFEPRFTRVNPHRRIRSMKVHRLLLAPPAGVRAVSHAVMPQRIRRLVGDCLRHLNASVEPRPAIGQQLSAKLKREFEPDVDTLSRLLNRDLSGWYR